MPDKIVQEMGFDCSQAINALERLNKAFTTTGASIEKFASATKAFNQASGAVTQSMDTTAKATERLTVSWGLLARVVTTQLIVSEFGRLRRAFADAAKSAVEFERSIALIRTIDDTGQSFDRLADSVRRLSDQFNIPLLEASAGVYQAISNQVGNFADSLEFSAKAAQFAKSTNSSLRDSADLLSSGLKSYGLGVEDTGKVAGVFFSIIDKGRIEASQLANAFGRVGPLAAQMGVPLEDLGGSLAAISVQGSKASETLTMYRSILSSLLKPTPELTAQLNKMGFASSEAAVQTLHVDGVLRELIKSTGGSSQTMARLFTNLRAETGIASLANDFKTLADDIEAARKAGANFAQEKWLTATATNAEKATAEINRLKNAWTFDLGRAVLQSGVDLSRWVGGADSLIDVAKSAGPALLGLGAGFLALRGSIAASRAELALLSRGLGLLALVPVAAGVGSSIGKYAGSQMVEEAERNMRRLEDATAQGLERIKRQQSELRDSQAKMDQARIQNANLAIRELNQSYLSEVETAKRANEAIVKNAQAGLRDYLTAREQLVHAFARGVAEANEAIEVSQKRITDLTTSAEERKFGRDISRLDDPEKIVRMLSRARDLASDAGRALSRAVSGDEIADSLKLFERAFATGEQAESIAARINSRELEVKAARALSDITDGQVRAERALQGIQADRAEKLEKERATQQEIVDSIRESIKVLLDNSKQFDKQGQLLSPDDLAKQAALRQDALQRIAGTALTSKDLDLTKALGLADFVNRFSADLSREPIRLAFDVEEGLQKVRADVQAAFETFKVEMPLMETLEEVLGKEFKTPDEAVRGFSELQKKATELRAALDAATASQKNNMTTVRAMSFAAEESLDRVAARLQDKRVQGFGAWGDATKALKVFREALADPNLDAERLSDLTDALQPLAERTTLTKWGGTWNVENLTDFTAALEALTSKVQAMRKMETPLPDTTELEKVEGIIQGVSNVGGAIQAGVEPSETIARNLERAADATARIAGSWTGEGMAFGGMAYFASGGRGTDTIPAWLSRGEMVINAESSRRFASQLTAINAGITPIYRETGGTVTNTTVGDIVINGAGQPSLVAREVMKAIRRETRRGTGTL